MHKRVSRTAATAVTAVALITGSAVAANAAPDDAAAIDGGRPRASTDLWSWSNGS